MRRPPTSRAARARSANASSDAAVARRQKLLIEVEERDHVGLADSMERGLGADDHPRRRFRPVDGRSTADIDNRLAREGLELLPHPRHAGSKVLEPGGMTVEAHGRARRRAPSAHERVLGLGDGGIAPLARRQDAACGAGEESGSSGAVQHAHHTSRRLEHSDERVRVQTGSHRIGGAPRVHNFDGGPALALRVPAGTDERTPPERLEARARRDEEDGDAGSPTSLDRDVARVPGGNPLLLQGLVVLVDHHDRGRFLDGRPRRRSGSDGDTGACRGLGPIAWHDGDTDSRSPDATGEASGHVDRRGHDEHGSEARRGEHDRQMIDGRRHAHHCTGRIEHTGWEVGILPPRRHGAHERRRQPRHERGRRCGDEERRRPSEPPPRCPTRQRHDIRRRAETAHAEHLGEDDTRGRLDVELDHPARHPATVQRHAYG